MEQTDEEKRLNDLVSGHAPTESHPIHPLYIFPDAIIKNRKGEIEIKPGYDGVYGVPVLDEKEEKIEIKQGQKGLDEFYKRLDEFY